MDTHATSKRNGLGHVGIRRCDFPEFERVEVGVLKAFCMGKEEGFEKNHMRGYFLRENFDIRGMGKTKRKGRRFWRNFSERLRCYDFWRKREREKEGGEILIEMLKRKKRKKVGFDRERESWTGDESGRKADRKTT